MPVEIDWDTRQRAEELYIYDGLNFEQVADETGISVSQLKRWGGPSEGKWVERRRDYRKQFNDIRRLEMEAARNFMAQAAETNDPQAAYAARAMSERLLKLSERKIAKKAENPPMELKISTPEDAQEALREAIEKKLWFIMQNLSSTGSAEIRGVQDIIKLWKQVSEKQDSPELSPQVVDEATLKTIREQIGLL